MKVRAELRALGRLALLNRLEGALRTLEIVAAHEGHSCSLACVRTIVLEARRELDGNPRFGG